MAYLTIITGTYDFKDYYGYMRDAFLKNPLMKYTIGGITFKKRRFDRVIITEAGQVVNLPPIMAYLKGDKWAVTQTMGSGKTILAMEHLARIHRAGGRTGANMSVEWFPHNQGKDRDEWRPNVNSLGDLEQARNITIGFDDIKRTIARWNAEEATLISKIVNASRKESVNMLITTQRVINFVPPDLREVCTNYEIPYITIRDQRINSPDSMGYPLEMEVFNVSANGVFMGFGVFNGYVPDGKALRPSPRLLNAYHTLEIAQDLGQDQDTPDLMNNTELEPYKGYNMEVEVMQELEKYAGEPRHLAAENPRNHETDITFNNGGKLYHIDAVTVTGYKKGNRTYYKLETARKDLMDLWQRAQAQGVKSYLAFKWKDKIRFLDVKHLSHKSGNVDYGKELKSKTKLGYSIFKPKPI